MWPLPRMKRWGKGAEHFDVEGASMRILPIQWMAEAIDEICYENFNAAQAEIVIHGRSIHPGTAKNKMVNASLLAMQFHSMLPVELNPAYTEGYEGFNHLTHMEGECEKATLTYIIRNHDDEKFAAQKAQFTAICDYLNDRYGEGTFEADDPTDQYRNMRAYHRKGYVRGRSGAEAAIAAAGLTPRSVPVRGGTDGATLTYMGLALPEFRDRQLQSPWKI